MSGRTQNTLPWVPVTNSETTPVPPYGVMEISGIDQSTGFATVTKPSVDRSTAVLFNGATPIPPSKSGQGHQSFPAIVAYQADDGSGADPAHGENWGTLASSWYLHKNRPGFQTVGAGKGGLVNVIPQIVRRMDFVRITSVTTSAGRYPGLIEKYDPDTPAWSDTAIAVWVIDPNSNLLGLKIGEATLIGYTNGRPVYSASANLWDDGAC